MSGTSKKTTLVTVRLKNEDIAKIQQAIGVYNNPDLNVRDYVQRVIHQWVWRHDKKVSLPALLNDEVEFPTYDGGNAKS